MTSKGLSMEHLGYKLIAFLITMILWVTVVSQRELISMQKLEVQFVVPEPFLIEGNSKLEVEVKVEGPRSTVKRFVERSWPTKMLIPVRNPVIGSFQMEIPVAELQLPPEMKVLSVQPREVVLQINKTLR